MSKNEFVVDNDVLSAALTILIGEMGLEGLKDLNDGVDDETLTIKVPASFKKALNSISKSCAEMCKRCGDSDCKMLLVTPEDAVWRIINAMILTTLHVHIMSVTMLSDN